MTIKKLIIISSAAVLLAASSVSAEIVWPELIVHLHKTGHAYLVDPATDKVVADIKTNKGGTLGSTTPNGKRVYVGAAATGEDTVTVLDLKLGKAVAHIKTGNRPKHPQVSPDGKMVVVNHWGLDNGKLRVSFIDTATNKVARNVDLEVGNANPKGVTSMHNSWSLDSRYVFTVDRVDNQLAIIDTQNWSVMNHDVQSKPHYPVPSPDGKELWLVLEGVDKINLPGIRVYDLTKPSFPKIASMNMPLIGEEVIEGHHGNFTQDGKHFMMLNRGGGKNIVGREVAFFDVKTKQLVRRLTTASNGIGHAYNSPDGRYTMITNYGNNTVSIIDTHTMNPVEDFTIGKGRMGHVAYTKDGRYAYISNAGDGNLHKLDMSNMKLVGEIKTGNQAGGGQVLNVWNNVFEELPR